MRHRSRRKYKAILAAVIIVPALVLWVSYAFDRFCTGYGTTIKDVICG